MPSQTFLRLSWMVGGIVALLVSAQACDDATCPSGTVELDRRCRLLSDLNAPDAAGPREDEREDAAPPRQQDESTKPARAAGAGVTEQRRCGTNAQLT